VHPQRIPPPLRLPARPESSAAARRFVRHALQALGDDALVDSAELGVSEMVTNALLHARTPITVALKVLAAGVVRIEVSDQSPRQPEFHDHDLMSTTGRGLRLLSSYGTWGVDALAAGPGKTVWFQPSGLI
jgi:anti-sigma regulatory factor (Ser/Thr protein kinase)